MKVLVVLNQPPHPEGNAPGRCAVGLLRGLSSHGLEVKGIAARPDFAGSITPPADLGVEVVPVPPGGQSWRDRMKRVTRPRGELLHPDFLRAVSRAAETADVVHLEETHTAWADIGLTHPSLVHLHYLVRRDRQLGAPWRRAFRDVLQFELAERVAIRRHRHLVASSPLIAAELRRRAPGADVVLAPLSLDPAHYPQAPLDGPPIAGLIGTASWTPTERAVRRLLEHVWPAVRRSVPDARLLLAGKGMSAFAGASRAEGVEVVGEVPSAAEFMRRLSLLLFPLDRGSGMKVKVLEAIASGVPVVTTRAGAEGIEAGSGIVAKDGDADLAQAAAVLLRDPEERRQRGAAARAAFAHRYEPRPATQPLVQLYERMVE